MRDEPEQEATHRARAAAASCRAAGKVCCGKRVRNAVGAAAAAASVQLRLLGPRFGLYVAFVACKALKIGFKKIELAACKTLASFLDQILPLQRHFQRNRGSLTSE